MIEGNNLPKRQYYNATPYPPGPRHWIGIEKNMCLIENVLPVQKEGTGYSPTFWPTITWEILCTVSWLGSRRHRARWEPKPFQNTICYSLKKYIERRRFRSPRAWLLTVTQPRKVMTQGSGGKARAQHVCHSNLDLNTVPSQWATGALSSLEMLHYDYYY